VRQTERHRTLVGRRNVGHQLGKVRTNAALQLERRGVGGALDAKQLLDGATKTSLCNTELIFDTSRLECKREVS
jgi:hypothetical protein